MATPHSYERVREAMIDVLSGRTVQMAPPWQYGSLVHTLLTQLKSEQYTREADGQTIADIFWDLFRQGYITLGYNNSNDFWPFFRLSPFGRQSLATGTPIRFHDAVSYVDLVRTRVPDLPPLTETYLTEAIKDFYAGCLLSACVMLGVAAEIEFNRLLDTAIANTTHGHLFAATAGKTKISQKIDAFRKAYSPIKGNFKVEDIDNRLLNIQSILRISRNDAGHAMAASVSREEVFINLQMFVSYAGHLYELRQELK
jgi:hypothetical protein